jgi:RNA polymerase sigma-70 factor (ECF subfamily)
MAVTVQEMRALQGGGFADSASGKRIAEMFGDLDATLRSFLRRRIRSRDDADDLAQEVYLRMTRHPDLSQVQCLKAFAFQTALNLVRDRSRRSYTRSRQQSVPIEHVELPGGDDPMEQATHDEYVDLVDRALAQLPDNTRRALVLHRIEGLRYSDIAHCLGVSVSMVEKHISAALAVLREYLDVADARRHCQPTRATKPQASMNS